MATKKTTTKKSVKAKVPTKSAVTAVKKAPAKKAVAKKAPAKKAAPKKAAAPKTAARSISPEERYKMIELSAYFLAEKQGFASDPSAIWVLAEKEVDARIANGKI